MRNFCGDLLRPPTKKGSPRLTTQVKAVLSVIDTLPFDSPADEVYGSIRTQLELAGTPIGGNDLLIAAQADLPR
jgi:tRNA(fMet)-specific endonuclease VapC